MNWQIFGTIGYLSVIIGAAAIASWLLYWKKPRRVLVNAALVMVLVAWFGARLHSRSYISRIDIDPSRQLAEIQARQKAKEEALLNSRNDKVADVTFAEDAKGESIDTAGMDEADLKYLKAISENDSPDWKKNKKERGNSSKEDDSLESQIGANENTKGANVSQIEKKAKAEPILLEENAVMMARNLDIWNLRFSTILLWIGFVVVGIDYLRRANIYAEASPPIPLPSSLLNSIQPAPALVTLPKPPRRPLSAELSWLSRRGDRFLLFTNKPDQVGEIKTKLEPLKRRPWQIDLILVDDQNPTIDDTFVFESLWFRRASFIVDNSERSLQMLNRFCRMLEHRRRTKARCAQTVHIIWDLPDALSDSTLDYLKPLLEATGFSLIINS